MGVTSYSDCRSARARIAAILSDDSAEKLWKSKAEAVAINLKQLWDEEKAAMFDKDANDTVVAALVHDNLRMM